jgi:uncharacterized membrane protein YcaP (DUF421 family)
MDSVIRGVSVYVILLVIARLSGRRTLAQMTAFDFVLLLIVAETTQQALLGDDFSITNAVVLIITLFAFDIGLSYVKGRMPSAERWIDGSPTVLLAEGRLDERAMRRARVKAEDILAAAREQQGLERLDQIKFAVLENGGGISILPKQGESS